VPTLLLYQLLLTALVFLCLLLPLWCPDDPCHPSHLSCTPDTPRRKRSQDPKPCTGLLHKPLGAACAQRVDGHPKAPGSPPPVLPFPRGHRRTVATQAPFGPEPACSSHGGLGRGHVRAHGHPGGPSWRQVPCVSGHGSCCATPGPLLPGKRSAPERRVRGSADRAAGLGIRGTARVCALAPQTVRGWLVAATEPRNACAASCLHAWQRTPGQLDELDAVRSAGREGEVRAAAAVERLAPSPQWGWTALDPASTWRLSVPVGERPVALAQAVRPQIAQRLAPGWVPLLVRAGDPHARPALVAPCGHWAPPPRRQAPGPVPQPRGLPLPARRDAQGVKPTRRRRLGAVQPRVVCGTPAEVAQLWMGCGWQRHPAFGERLTRRVRQRVAALRRRSATPWKRGDGLSPQRILVQG
jgi:hypothetical protein